MKNPKIGVTLQVLMRSTRLKHKPIRKLCGREMVAHQIDRLKTANVPEVLILCTSDTQEDQILEDIALREGIEIFRGPKEDVMLRLLLAARKYDLDYILAPAGDNPLTCADHMDDLANYMVEHNMDYADGVHVLPDGLFCKAIKRVALEKACEIKSEEDTEGWMAWFVRTKGLFKTGKIQARDWIINRNLRLTVDTPKDFEVMEKIFEKFYIPGNVFPLKDVLQYLNEHPEIMEINKEIIQLPPSRFQFGLKPEYEKYNQT